MSVPAPPGKISPYKVSKFKKRKEKKKKKKKEKKKRKEKKRRKKKDINQIIDSQISLITQNKILVNIGLITFVISGF